MKSSPEAIDDMIKELSKIRDSGPLKPPHLPPVPPSAILGGMDPWQSSVETRLGQLHTGIEGLRSDLNTKFLWLLGAFGAGFIALAGLIISLADIAPKH